MCKSGDPISDTTVGNYMREMGIRACYTKHYTQTTKHPERPDATWCSDITYLWTWEGFVYLTSIMDLFSRKIISWVLSETLEARWVVEAVEKAKRERNMEAPFVIHSDRGVQYTSRDYVEAVEGVRRSDSQKVCPWDHACIESFHSLLKREWATIMYIELYSSI